MNRAILALLASLATACAEPASLYPEPAPEPTTWLKPGQLGYEAQLAWGLPLHEDFGVIILPPDLFLLNCQAVNEGCDSTTLGTALQAEHRALLRDDLGEITQWVLMHEMGHLLRGYGGHPAAEDCAEAPVMCGDWTATHPGPADFDFVIGAR